MGLAQQTVAMLKAARQLVDALPADAVLILAEGHLDWEALRAPLDGCPLLVAVPGVAPARLREAPGCVALEIDLDPAPVQERMTLALLKGIAGGHLQPGSHVVVLYNGIAADDADRPEPVDSVSVLHLSEHLERLTSRDLRNLHTPVPVETLRLVVDLATEIGREGRESKPVGALLVVGDTRKVMGMSRPINFNPFRGYRRDERDLRDRRVREQIKDIAQLDGALVISRDGIAEAACLYLDVVAEGITLSKGLGSRHWAAAAISRRTRAVAVVVSQSSGAVRLFVDGEVVLHIEPLARPHIWQPFRLGTQEPEGGDPLPV